MSHYDAMQGQRISKRDAIDTIKAEGGDVDDFIAECGDRRSYDAQTVLRFLGY